jgi:UPF0042 nucleotide-binding protein
VSEFLIITGMSGAGRSTAADTFEDGGWFVIDNMPPSLISKVADLVNRPGSDSERVALVIGRGGPESTHEIEAEIETLRRGGHQCRVLFLDAADDVLVRRFEGTRRRHPLTAESVHDGIRRERATLEGLRDLADVVVDTTELNVHQLRGRLIDLFERGDPSVGMQTTVMSFGYKYGVPLDVDLVLDCRFLPNPHWVDELRPLTGEDEPVRQYVLAQPETGEFVRRLGHLFDLILPAYVKEGKAYLTIAIGCTGGRHRSVVLAEQVARLVEDHGFKPTLLHRDVNR